MALLIFAAYLGLFSWRLRKLTTNLPEDNQRAWRAMIVIPPLRWPSLNR